MQHDTVEDTDTTLEELAREFSPRVAAIVAEVSDDKNQSKVQRVGSSIALSFVLLFSKTTSC